MFNEMFRPEFIAALDTEDDTETNRMKETPDDGLDDDVGFSPRDTTG